MFIIQVHLLAVFCFTLTICTEHENIKTNLTSPKDMYLVRATVYQVGILTNKTNETSESNAGHQEAITIYHKNGSNFDLSSISDPLLTNVTAEKMVGVAPVTNETVPWTALKELVSAPHFQETSSRSSMNMNTNDQKTKREVEKPLEIEKGIAIVPSEAGVQSIAIPPLLTLNKNQSKIPVPIPNVSVVSYAKVNTVVHSTE